MRKGRRDAYAHHYRGYGGGGGGAAGGGTDVEGEEDLAGVYPSTTPLNCDHWDGWWGAEAVQCTTHKRALCPTCMLLLSLFC